jgi:polar amino acid transport system substrate-binding protein
MYSLKLAAKNTVLAFLACIFAFSKIGTASDEETLHFLTNGMRPYVTVDGNGNHSGIAYELVKEIAKESGLQHTMDVTYWSAAYNRALERENALIFPLDFTDAREDQFAWIAPILDMEYALFSLKGKYPAGTGINNLIASGATVSCSKNTIHCEILKEAGFPGKQIIQIEKLIIRAKHKWLLQERGDLTIMDPRVYYALGNDLEEIDPTLTDQLVTVSQKRSYLAANKSMHPTILERLKAAAVKVLNEAKENAGR